MQIAFAVDEPIGVARSASGRASGDRARERALPPRGVDRRVGIAVEQAE